MPNWLSKQLAKIVDSLLCFITSFITGVRPKNPRDFLFSSQRKIYFANHNSHGDFVLVWVSLPKRWRMNTKPVAGADYWLGNKLKRFIVERVFNALLIDRTNNSGVDAIEQMNGVLKTNQSLIIFPEGTRNTEDDVLLQPFKSGIYHLAKSNPDAQLIPVWIDNMNRVLPKGQLLPVPLLCDVNIGSPIQLLAGESKDDFLQRARQAMLQLVPETTQSKELS
jgi:1-acyl-sn-glycerol-3-phosphate acyltransferase